KSLPLYRYPSTATKTVGSICLNRSITIALPKSGEQLDHIAPILADAKKAITDSGIFGIKATTRSPFCTPASFKLAAKEDTRRESISQDISSSGLIPDWDMIAR